MNPEDEPTADRVEAGQAVYTRPAGVYDAWC